MLDGCSERKERENRAKGVNFILQVGMMLKLPQITLSTASVFLHRFYMRHSMEDSGDRKGFHYYPIAASCLFLATKVEENCRKMKELVIACVKVAQKDPNKQVDEQDREYWRWKDNILHNEDLLMEALCFDFSLDPPYKTLFDLLLQFKVEDNKPLRNAAWAFINDSCMTVMCLLFPSRTIAASALYAAAKHCDYSFPDDEDGKPWWEIAGISLAEVRKGCNFLADIYEPIQASRARKGSINYEHTPENKDGGSERTRAAPEHARLIGGQPDQRLNGYRQLSRSGAGLEESLENSKWNEANGAAEESGNDRFERDINGTTHERSIKVDNGHVMPAKAAQDPDGSGGLVSPVLDDVSEEGELEN